MMSHMEQPTTKQPAIPYPMTPDGKYKYTTRDGRPKIVPSTTVPGLFDSQIFPDWVHNQVRKLFKRAPKEL
jgi:hypothetical protein